MLVDEITPVDESFQGLLGKVENAKTPGNQAIPEIFSLPDTLGSRVSLVRPSRRYFSDDCKRAPSL